MNQFSEQADDFSTSSISRILYNYPIYLDKMVYLSSINFTINTSTLMGLQNSHVTFGPGFSPASAQRILQL